jgi:hypothetical protein
MEKQISKMDLLRSEVSKFAWLNLNRCGGVCNSGPHYAVWRIGALKANRGRSVVRVVLERQASGQTVSWPYLDELGPIGPKLPPDKMKDLLCKRMEREAEYLKGLTLEQNSFLNTIEDYVKEIFCTNTTPPSGGRVTECFCMANMEQKKEFAFMLQIYTVSGKKSVETAKKKLQDWKFELTDLAFDSTTPIHDQNAVEARVLSAISKAYDTISLMLNRTLDGITRNLTRFSSFSNVDLPSVAPNFPEREFTYSTSYSASVIPPVPGIKHKLRRHRIYRPNRVYKVDIIVNMLQSGEPVRKEKLAEAVYGKSDAAALKGVRRIISSLRNCYGAMILVKKGAYTMERGPRLALGSEER